MACQVAVVPFVARKNWPDVGADAAATSTAVLAVLRLLAVTLFELPVMVLLVRMSELDAPIFPERSVVRLAILLCAILAPAAILASSIAPAAIAGEAAVPLKSPAS